jgi:hypothetical protein
MAVLSLSRALLLAGAALPMQGFAQTILNQEGEVIRRFQAAVRVSTATSC